MAEDPEEVLPEQRIAAAGRIEEGPVERALELEEDVAGDERWEGEEDHPRHHQHVPGVERDQVDPHPRRPGLEHADDQLHRSGDRRDLDEGEAEEPDVGADALVVGGGERRVHEPAAGGRCAEEDRAADEDAADGEAVEGVGREAGKGQVPAAQELRQHQDREAFEDRNGEEEHHHRSVQREHLVVLIGGEEIAVREGELQPHQEGEDTAEEQEEEGADRVPLADFAVVDGGPVAPARRRLPRGEEPLGLRAAERL